jgi:hypothetical protein
MRCHLDWLGVREGLQAGIELRGASQLDMKRARQEERAESQACAQIFAAADEVESRS